LTGVETAPFDPDDESTDESTEDERRVYAPRLNSRGSIVLGAAMMGLQIGMYGEVDKPEITIEADANGQDDGINVELDPDDPSRSTIVIRPH
jgi:hypothetical protein